MHGLALRGLTRQRGNPGLATSPLLSVTVFNFIDIFYKIRETLKYAQNRRSCSASYRHIDD